MRIFLLVLLLLAACAPSAQAIGNALPTDTPIPFSALNFQSIILWPGDLRPHFEPSDVQTDVSALLFDVPTPDYFISETFSFKPVEGEELTGSRVQVMVYEDISKVNSAYRVALGGMSLGKKTYIEVGENAQASTEPNGWVEMLQSSLVFKRCHAVVSIFLLPSIMNDVVFYAKRLDARLTPLVCRA